MFSDYNWCFLAQENPEVFTRVVSNGILPWGCPKWTDVEAIPIKYAISQILWTFPMILGHDTHGGAPMNPISLSTIPNFHRTTIEDTNALLFELNVIYRRYDYITYFHRGLVKWWFYIVVASKCSSKKTSPIRHVHNYPIKPQERGKFPRNIHLATNSQSPRKITSQEYLHILTKLDQDILQMQKCPPKVGTKSKESL